MGHGDWADAPEDLAKQERDGAIRFAALCEATGVRHITLLSSIWANRSSKMPFARMQGEVMDEVVKMDGFKRVSIFRPSLAVDKEKRAIGVDAMSFWSKAVCTSCLLLRSFFLLDTVSVPLTILSWHC